jgi:hypothetical protein
MARAQELIATSYQRLTAEVPALDRLKLVIRLELRGRRDVQVFRVRCPGPEITKGEPEDARVDVALSRSHFNELAADGRIKDWREAYEHGHVKFSGDRRIQRLVETVIEKQAQRDRAKKVRR